MYIMYVLIIIKTDPRDDDRSFCCDVFSVCPSLSVSRYKKKHRNIGHNHQSSIINHHQTAILSVPLLGIQKICCSYANHPLAKIMLSMIREDATIDEAAEAANAGLPIPGIGGKDDEEDSEVAVANPMTAAAEEDDDDE